MPALSREVGWGSPYGQGMGWERGDMSASVSGGEIGVFITTHGLEESSALCSQGNLRWKGSIRSSFTLSEVVCGMESSEPLRVEKPNQELLRYFCEVASSPELFSREGDALMCTRAGDTGWKKGSERAGSGLSAYTS